MSKSLLKGYNFIHTLFECRKTILLYGLHRSEKLRSLLLELVYLLRNVLIKESSNEFNKLNNLLKEAASDKEIVLTIGALLSLFEDVKNSIQVSRDKSGLSQEESRYESEAQHLRQHALNSFNQYIKNNNYNDRVVANFTNLFWELFEEFKEKPEIVKFFNDAGMYIKDSLECPTILSNKTHNDIVRNLNSRAISLFSVAQNKDVFTLLEITLSEAETLLNVLNDQQAKQKGKEMPRAFDFTSTAHVHQQQRQPPLLWHSKETRQKCQEMCNQPNSQHFESLSKNQQQPPELWTCEQPVHPAVKQQVIDIVTPILMGKFKEISIPRVQGNVENNRFHFALDNMTMSLHNIENNQICVEMSPEANNLILKLSITHLSSHITNAHYEFYEKSTPKVINGGVANIDVGGMAIRLKWRSPMSSDFNFSLAKARCRVGSTHANIRDAKHNWLMILLGQLFEGEVKEHIERAVEACLIDNFADIGSKFNSLNLQK